MKVEGPWQKEEKWFSKICISKYIELNLCYLQMDPISLYVHTYVLIFDLFFYFSFYWDHSLWMVKMTRVWLTWDWSISMHRTYKQRHVRHQRKAQYLFKFVPIMGWQEKHWPSTTKLFIYFLERYCEANLIDSTT